MRLFERSVKPDEFRLAFEQGLLVGQLRADLEHLKTQLGEVKAALPAGQGFAPLDPKIDATLTKLSRNDPALYRFLEAQAKELLAAGLPTEAIIEQLTQGAKFGPRIEKKA